MGKTWHKNSKKFENEVPKRGKKGSGMKTLNTYYEEDYDDPFEDELEIHDSITIQLTKDVNTI